jgi:hypothetical protein
MKFPAFYGTWRFFTTCKSTYYLSPSWARSVQSMLLHPNYWRSILTSSSHLYLIFQDVFFTEVSPTKLSMQFSCFPYMSHAQPISSLEWGWIRCINKHSCLYFMYISKIFNCSVMWRIPDTLHMVRSPCSAVDPLSYHSHDHNRICFTGAPDSQHNSITRWGQKGKHGPHIEVLRKQWAKQAQS